jgi:N4-gp56 family major capsid protein
MANVYTGAADGTNVTGIPANILTLHTNDLLFEALPVMRYDQFAVVRTDLMADPGDTISFSKYGNLTRGGSIAEDADLESEAMSKSAVTISVTEYGKAVGLTSKLLTLSFMDEMMNASVLLGRDYAVVVDIMLRNALFSGTQTYFAENAANAAALDADSTLALADIDNMIEILETGNALKYADANGEYFVSYIHPHQAKALKQALRSVHQYQYPELIFKGEIGEYGGVRFISTANVPNGADATTTPGYDATLKAGYDQGSGNNAVDLYKMVIFGQRAYGWAVALPVELREDIGQTNFGRKRRLAWYAIMGAGKIVNENIIVAQTS